MRRAQLLIQGLIASVAAACGEGSETTDAATLDAAALTDARADPDGGAILAEGMIAVLFHSVHQVEPELVDVTFAAWAPSAVEPYAVLGHHEREIASGAQLAVGACGAITKPPLPQVTAIAGGDDVVFTSGAGTIVLDVERPGHYAGRDETAPARHLGRDLALTLGAGSAPHGGPGTLPLGRVPGMTAAAPSPSCGRGAPCSLGVTVEAVDELYVVVALGQVCRLDPTRPPAIPIAALAGEVDGPHSLRLYAIRRGPSALGGAVYEAIVVHELGMLFQLGSQ